ncbi:MMPL family transporter [Marinococcus halotolerans]|uniref:MMPL family transporter n=1 Tax=Marinococcus halotolerans TaxID=301092 RepID=UPI0003B419D0|nr:MMPL family transporter [Marinococcus halotolerans]
MKTILQFRWWIASLILIFTVVLTVVSPSLSNLAADKETLQIPEEETSSQAQEILDDNGEGGNTISAVIQTENQVDGEEQENIQSLITSIEDEDIEGVSEVTDPFGSEETEEQLVASGENVVVIPISIEGNSDTAVNAAEEIRDLNEASDMEMYVTGESLLNQQVNEASQEGLERTEVITVVLILALLFVVFRAVITPFVPLVAVGLTYLISQSIIAYLVDWFNFPVSNYTQIFLVAVLFGIGTDYCILLLSRYREELAAGLDYKKAIIRTYKTAGKTMVYSALAVLVGFTAIGFANFSVFQSGVGVAVGIVVLTGVLWTILPFFMLTLKKALFWPSKLHNGHADSKIWKWLSRVSVFRPLLAILIVAVVTVPLLLTFDNSRSYDTIDEIDQDTEEVTGLNLIEEGLGSGQALPMQIVIESDASVMEPETLAYVEDLNRSVSNLDEVEAVRSATRPAGDVIEDFYVNNQIEDVSTGISDARDGIEETENGLQDVEDGLAAIQEQLGSSDTENSSLQDAADGLGEVNTALGQVSTQLANASSPQEASAASEQLTGISQQITEIQSGLEEGQQELDQQTEELDQLAETLGELENGVSDSRDGLTEISDGLESAETFTGEVSEANYVEGTGVYLPEDTIEDEDFQDGASNYVFDNENGMTIEVGLNADPYSKKAIQSAEEVKEVVEMNTQGTPLEDATIEYGGVPSVNSDLQSVSSSDFDRTVLIVLVGIFAILIILLRNIIQPLYIIGGLVLAYFTAMAVTELIFVNGLGYPGIAWPVPFFGFVMLVALGVDYSIFLLSRYNEEAKAGVRTGMQTAMIKMGTVIITAAIILSGTFAAMLPSGVLTLLEVATVVITGLLLFGLIVLPLLIPALISFNSEEKNPKKKQKQQR